MKRWLIALALSIGLSAEAQTLSGGLLGRGAASAVPAGCAAGSVAVFLGSPVGPACAADWSYTAGTPAVPESLGPEILTNGDFAEGTTGWGVAAGWTWYETVGAESGCVTHGTEWGTGSLTQYEVPVTEFIAGHTYRISAVVIGTTIGTFGVHIWGYDDDTYTPVASESFEWEFVAPAYGGETVQVDTPITDTFDGSVCSVSIVEVLSPPVSATASRVELAGAFEATSISLPALHDAPASATATCAVGEIRWTATHVYLCSATDTWVRAALATWP